MCMASPLMYDELLKLIFTIVNQGPITAHQSAVSAFKLYNWLLGGAEWVMPDGPITKLVIGQSFKTEQYVFSLKIRREASILWSHWCKVWLCACMCTGSSPHRQWRSLLLFLHLSKCRRRLVCCNNENQFSSESHISWFTFSKGVMHTIVLHSSTLKLNIFV